MTDRVDPSVKTMQLPTSGSLSDAVPGHPSRSQLPICGDPMLSLRDSRDCAVERVDLFPHGVNKSTRHRTLPPWGEFGGALVRRYAGSVTVVNRYSARARIVPSPASL